MLTGIYGGSFNPIHKGHVNLALALRQHQYVDEVWLMVSPQNPLKSSLGLLPEEVRLGLARKATEHLQGIRVSDFELTLPRPSYSYNTLQALTEAYPERDFALVIGADCWCSFTKWRNWAEIIARWPVIIYPRSGFRIDAEKLPQGVVLAANMPLFPYSSTDIRRLLHEGKDISDLVCGSTEAWLLEHRGEVSCG